MYSRRPMKNICVYCGSQKGRNPYFQEITSRVGTMLAKKGFTIICGGVTSGLMGLVADSALAAGARVIGVIETQILALGEKLHEGLTTLHLVESPIERKEKMSILAHLFLILPGGMGCLEELFDVWSEARLHLHNKPIILFNVAGYYDGLLKFIDHMVAEGFMKPDYLRMLRVVNSYEELEDLLAKKLA